MGRLHTRYSPVRRSPPASYPAALPLDLHVLSLSLAFILSQDQTLRCCLSFFLFFSDKKHRPLSPDRWLLLDGGFRPLCLSCLTVALFQCPLCSSEPLLRRLPRRPRFGVASAKVQQILLPTKLFYNFFVLNFHAFLQSTETQQNSITIFFQTNFETTVLHICYIYQYDRLGINFSKKKTISSSHRHRISYILRTFV